MTDEYDFPFFVLMAGARPQERLVRESAQRRESEEEELVVAAARVAEERERLRLAWVESEKQVRQRM